MLLNHCNPKCDTCFGRRSTDSQNRGRWLNRPIASGAFRSWLIERGSLTLRLKNQFEYFSVKPQRQLNQKCFIDDASLLQLSSRQKTLIREVTLTSRNQPLVFAHSVIPLKSLKGAWRSLGRLGNRSLGSALFANPLVTRTPITFKKLSAHHPLYQLAAQHQPNPPPYFWARRSVFELKSAKILVIEVFLPNCIQTAF